MALFAGDVGIDAGDELTYDYNFKYVITYHTASDYKVLTGSAAGLPVLTNSPVNVALRTVVVRLESVLTCPR